jgi:hypothetical protein
VATTTPGDDIGDKMVCSAACSLVANDFSSNPSIKAPCLGTTAAHHTPPCVTTYMAPSREQNGQGESHARGLGFISTPVNVMTQAADAGIQSLEAGIQSLVASTEVGAKSLIASTQSSANSLMASTGAGAKSLMESAEAGAKSLIASTEIGAKSLVASTEAGMSLVASTEAGVKSLVVSTEAGVKSLVVSTEAVLDGVGAKLAFRSPGGRRPSSRRMGHALSRMSIRDAVERATLAAPPNRIVRARGFVKRGLRVLDVFFGAMSVLYLLLIVFDMLLEGIEGNSCQCHTARPLFDPSASVGVGLSSGCVTTDAMGSMYGPWFEFFKPADLAFLCFFTLEICARLFVNGAPYLTSSPLNAVDAAAIATSLVLDVLSLLPTLDVWDTEVIRLFRIFRVVKVLSVYTRVQQLQKVHKGATALSHAHNPPTCNWETAPRINGFGKAKTYACFLSHYKIEAGMCARYVHDMMQRMLNGVPVFLDSTELTDLNAIFENGVLKCETLAVFLTDSVFTRPWCLLEIFEAHRHGIPIILLAAHGTSSSTSDVLGKAEQFIERLEDNLNPEILKQIEP